MTPLWLPRPFAAWVACVAFAASSHAGESTAFTGTYRSRLNPSAFIQVSHLKEVTGAYVVRGLGTESVGYLHDSTYSGSIVLAGALGKTTAPGTLRIVFDRSGTIRARAVFPDGSAGFDDIWTPSAPPPPDPTPTPNPGEHVFVEELPEAITKVQPIYPKEAREAGIEGKVVIQALVVEDGSVAETKVQVSIPALDAAASECVRQWKFKPATAKGKPVRVWIAVPIAFRTR